MSVQPLQTIQQVIDTLGQHQQPVFFLNRPSIFLMGLERWLPHFYSIRLHNAWGMNEERAFSPRMSPGPGLSHTEAANWLLSQHDVHTFISAHTPAGFTPKIAAFLHDERTEALCEQLGYELMAPPASLRTQLDGKLFTTELSETCGLRNVPHVITTVSSGDELMKTAQNNGLGTHLVVQTNYGEGGAGTYFVRSAHEVDAHAQQIIGVPVKIMKHIRHRALAMEAVIVPGGIVLGPLLQEIVGHKEVAVHGGSSSGLEHYADVVSPEQRQLAARMVTRYGEQLAKLGYLGLFEVDLLHDLDTDELFFGESNPRFSGCAMVTNAVTAELWGLPLYALHLYAFLDEAPPIDVDSFNRTWQSVQPGHEWSNLLIRHVAPATDVILDAPNTGSYRVGQDGALAFNKRRNDWYDLVGTDEVFFVSYRTTGDIRVHGDDIGTLFVRGRLQQQDGHLTDQARTLVSQILAQYRTTPLPFLSRATRSLRRRLRALRS